MLAIDGHVLLACEVIGHHNLQYPGAGVGNGLRLFSVDLPQQRQIQVEHIVFSACDQLRDLVLIRRLVLLFHSELHNDFLPLLDLSGQILQNLRICGDRRGTRSQIHLHLALDLVFGDGTIIAAGGTDDILIAAIDMSGGVLLFSAARALMPMPVLVCTPCICPGVRDSKISSGGNGLIVGGSGEGGPDGVRPGRGGLGG